VVWAFLLCAALCSAPGRAAAEEMGAEMGASKVLLAQSSAGSPGSGAAREQSADRGPARGYRFGDSTWVAPYADFAEASAPDVDGARVAEPDHTPAGESALRLPFRVIAFPFRMVGLGFEQAAGAIETQRPGQRTQSRSAEPPGAFRPRAWLPYFDWAERATLRLGVNLSFGQAAERARSRTHAALSGGKADWQVERDRKLAEAAVAAGNRPPSAVSPIGGVVDVSWSISNHRRAAAEVGVMGGESPIGFGGDIAYNYRPNLLFFGIGPEAPRSQRSAYLTEEGKGNLFLQVGRRSLMRLRVGGGISHISLRDGNDAPNIAEEFPPAERTSLNAQSTSVARYGASLLFGNHNGAFERTQPISRGFDLRGEAWRYNDLETSALEWTEWRGEARAYLPVFADRRVIALRGVYASVHPDAGSPPVPFYRLPESAGEHYFRAFDSGRFRDRHLTLGELEYRWWLWEWLWFVGFGQLGWVAPSSTALRFDQVHESYGGGIRVALTSNLLYRLDIGHGSEGTRTNFRLGAQF
jgi:hypothetical protein